MQIFILTYEINQYDQEGAYYLGAFKQKPSPQQLVDLGVPNNEVEHVLYGGGRIGNQYRWYFLEKVEI